mmetsp:Transcript_33413/g.83785  ORF Transcript_33413/g.83785 Transcript_33413/m.83785 type:complete len:216 (-) Transcript_33413:98-745(-)
MYILRLASPLQPLRSSGQVSKSRSELRLGGCTIPPLPLEVDLPFLAAAARCCKVGSSKPADPMELVPRIPLSVASRFRSEFSAMSSLNKPLIVGLADACGAWLCACACVTAGGAAEAGWAWLLVTAACSEAWRLLDAMVSCWRVPPLSRLLSETSKEGACAGPAAWEPPGVCTGMFRILRCSGTRPADSAYAENGPALQSSAEPLGMLLAALWEA